MLFEEAKQFKGLAEKLYTEQYPHQLNYTLHVGFNLNSFQCKQAESVAYNSFLSCRLAENVSLEYWVSFVK